MDSLKKLINRHKPDFPEFNYYLPIIEKAENNELTHPDICIECCNSLIQGICKTIIIRLDDSKSEADFKAANTQDIVRPAMKLLKLNDDVVEDDFVRRSSSLALAVSTLRNARGDISHGRSVPKMLHSDMQLSKLVMGMTESFLRYTLACFYAIELSQEDEEDVFQKVSYEEYPEFNEYLDSLYPWDGKMLYSESLYDRYYEDYDIQLQEYLEQQELDET